MTEDLERKLRDAEGQANLFRMVVENRDAQLEFLVNALGEIQQCPGAEAAWVIERAEKAIADFPLIRR